MWFSSWSFDILAPGTRSQEPAYISGLKSNYTYAKTGSVNVPFRDFGHRLQIFVGDYIPNSWVMFNLDIYQPLIQPSCVE